MGEKGSPSGLGGGVLATLLAAGIFGVVGYATTAWTIDKPNLAGYFKQKGLWTTYSCIEIQEDQEHWFRAVIAMMSIGLICLAACMVFTFIYLCCNCKGGCMLFFVIALAYAAMVLFVIGVAIYGAYEGKHKTLSWSFGFAVLAAIFSLFAGVLASAQKFKS